MALLNAFERQNEKRKEDVSKESYPDKK